MVEYRTGAGGAAYLVTRGIYADNRVLAAFTEHRGRTRRAAAPRASHRTRVAAGSGPGRCLSLRVWLPLQA